MIEISPAELVFTISFCCGACFASGYLLKDIIDTQKAKRKEKCKR